MTRALLPLAILSAGLLGVGGLVGCEHSERDVTPIMESPNPPIQPMQQSSDAGTGTDANGPVGTGTVGAGTTGDTRR